MSSPRPPRRIDSAADRAGGGEQPVRVDGALRQTVALLELVRQEEALLGWLDDCVAQLQAVRRARQTLLDITDVELAEAKEAADQGITRGFRASGAVEQRGEASASARTERDCEGTAS